VVQGYPPPRMLSRHEFGVGSSVKRRLTVPADLRSGYEVIQTRNSSGRSPDRTQNLFCWLRNQTYNPNRMGRDCSRFVRGLEMRLKSFTYERSWYGTYYRQRFFSMERMDSHIAKMLSQRWQILTQMAHSGVGRGFRPFAKRDTITISFQRP
jgi:hypothetical protein